jgi:glycosyltransferase involved in cell wall biosynthesis
MITRNLTQPKPRLCFVGPMVGRNPGRVTTQGQILSDLFEAAGYRIISVSPQPNRYLRLADIVATLIRRRSESDIMVLDVFGGPSFVVEDIASWLGHRFGHRVVMCLRGGAMPEFMARYPRWCRRVLTRADALIAPSEFIARAIMPHGLRARVIPNIVRLPAYPYRHRNTLSPRMFWMRSFHPVYNPELAIRVLARVRVSVPEASLVMAGQDDGTQLAVQQLARNMDLNDAVKFPGFLDMEAKVREGDRADIFLNTNRIDNMPVAVVEACAMGLPVIATAVGGVPDLLTDGENGLLVPDDDEQAMAAAVQQLLKDPELAGRISENGRRLAERSSWEQVRPCWERVFHEVSASPKHGRAENL